MPLFLLVAAFFRTPGTRRALALFLITYCMVASFTQVGFAEPTTYLLELTLAASLLVPATARRLAEADDRAGHYGTVEDLERQAAARRLTGKKTTMTSNSVWN